MPVLPELPPIATQPLSVVLLAHAAPGDVETIVKGWLGYLDGRGQEYELILVDDAHARQLDHPRLRIVGLPTEEGEGVALQAGLAEAKHPLVFYTLCQPEYRPEDLGRMLDQTMQPPMEGRVIDHVHLLSGYRAGVRVPLPLRMIGWLWRGFCLVVFSYSPHRLPGWLGWRRHFGWLLTRIFFGLRCHDIGCPFRLIRRDILARIPIQSKGSFAHVELLAKANFLGCMMGEELPLDVRPGPYRGDARQIWRDARRVFDRPDFGPAVLVQPASASSIQPPPSTRVSS